MIDLGQRPPRNPGLSPGLTPMEAKAYAELGLNPAETKIAGVDEEIAKILADQDAAAAAEFPVDPAAPPLDFDEDRDATPLSKLSAEQRAELARKLKEMKDLEKEIDASRAAAASLAPGVGAAMALADAPPTIAADPPPSPPDDDHAPGDDSAMGRIRHCPRCARDVDAPIEETPSRMDRLSWLAGLQGARFRKEFALYDGEIVLTFRSPTSEETGLAHLQAGADDPANVQDYLTRVLEYEQALSLEKIAFADGKVRVSPIDQLLAGERRDGKATNLHAILEYGKTHVYPNASLARLVHAQFRRFRRLIEWMEVNWEREDFTGEISSPS